MRHLTLALTLAVTFAQAPSPRGTPYDWKSAATDAERVTPSGVISGVVSEASTARPLDGVNVQLGGQGTPGRSRVTDERGRFVFTGLAAGSYFINATKPGFADGHYARGTMGAVGGRIVITDGQWFSAANVGMTKLGAIAGLVADEHGEPVVGACVRVLTHFMLGGVPHLAVGPIARTDDRGEYRIVNLTPGKYFVIVPSVQQSVPASTSVSDIEGMSGEQLASSDRAAVARGGGPVRRSGGAIIDGMTALIVGNYPSAPPALDGRPQAYPMVFYPGALSLPDASFVELDPGADASGINLALRPVPAVRISGRLVGPTKSYAGFVLRLMPVGLEDLGIGSEAATTRVRSDGSFTFLNVPAGTYTLLAPGSTFEFAASSLATGSGLRTSGIPATPGLARYGSGASGGLVSAVEGVTYNALAPDTLTDDHAGYARVPVTVTDADIANLIVPLQPTAAIRGQLVYADAGQPTPTGTIELAPAGGSATLGVRNFVLGTSDALSAKTFRIAVVLPGEYVMRAIGMAGFTIKSISVDGEDCSRRPIAVAEGQDAMVVLTFTSRVIKVSGTVRDDHGAAVPQASVIAFPTDRRLWTNYGFTPTWIRASAGTSDGSYELANVRAGDYYLVAVEAARINAWSDPAFLESAAATATRATLNWGDSKTIDVRLLASK